MRKRTDGARSRAEYRGSLVVVPGLLAVLGAVVGLGIARMG
jgi:hypothetical protein